MDYNDYEETEEIHKRSGDENIIYVGKKGVMSYVLAVVTQFNAGATEVIVKARGKLISRAVDVLEITRNKFLRDITVKSITTSTEDMISSSGAPTKVSTIEIVLTRPSQPQTRSA